MARASRFQIPTDVDNANVAVEGREVRLTNLRKPFYMLESTTGEKQYVESYSAWFDTVNQFHGTDAHQGPGFSIRVDGVFTDAGPRAATARECEACIGHWPPYWLVVTFRGCAPP